jgi:hypothetical protein
MAVGGNVAAMFYKLLATGADGESAQVELTLLSEVPAVLQARWGTDEPRKYLGVDLFECLISVRADLESQSLLLCCQGARKNVSPSGMTRQMSNGRLAYLLPVGRPVSDEDLVDVFAPADCSEVVSVADQKAEIARIFRGH